MKTVLENAIKKIKTEMEQNGDNAYIQVVGTFLLQHLNAHPQDAEKILTAEKTVTNSLETMRKVAEKKKVGNMAVLTDQEGFAVVLKYFGIEPGDTILPAAAVSAAPQPVPEAKSRTDFDVRLEDLL